MPAPGFNPQREWSEAERPRGLGLALLVALVFVVPALLVGLGQCSAEPGDADAQPPAASESADARDDVVGSAAGWSHLAIA